MLFVGGVNTCDCPFIKGLSDVCRAGFICTSVLVCAPILILVVQFLLKYASAILILYFCLAVTLFGK